MSDKVDPGRLPTWAIVGVTLILSTGGGTIATTAGSIEVSKIDPLGASLLGAFLLVIGVLAGVGALIWFAIRALGAKSVELLVTVAEVKVAVESVSGVVELVHRATTLGAWNSGRIVALERAAGITTPDYPSADPPATALGDLRVGDGAT